MDILVIGGANLDIKAKCVGAHVAATSNISHISTKPGGVARNIAHNLAKLGMGVGLLSVVGKDAAGESLLQATAAAGVDISICYKAKGTTGTYLAFLDQNGELITAANDMAIVNAITPDVIFANKAKIETAKFILADCNLSSETLNAIVKLAAHKLIIEPVSVEKSERLKLLLSLSSVFLATPNRDQIEALTGTRDATEAAKILQDQGLHNLVIHAGQLGAFVFDGNTITQISSKAKKVNDVTGAGDAATAGLICGLIKGMPLVKACELGQELAAQVISTNVSTLE